LSTTAGSSILATRRPRQQIADRRPGYWRLLGGVLIGQAIGYVLLYAVCLLLSLAGLVGVSFRGLSPYLPWTIAGPWSAAAASAWALLVVVALVAPAVRYQAQLATNRRPALFWTAVAVAIGGYVPLSMHSSVAGRAAISTLLTTLLLSTLAYDRRGRPRDGPPALSGRLAWSLGAAAALLLVTYTLSHPFVADGSGAEGSAASLPSGAALYALRPGATTTALVGLDSARLPAKITAVTLVDPTSDVQLDAVRLALDSPPLGDAGMIGLPFRVPASHSAWISLTVSLRNCPSTPVALTRLRLHYRILGLDLTQTVDLQNPTGLNCKGAPA
jgi:hypothetical protein